MIPNPLLAFDALMQETPYSHFDSGCEGITPECRTCRFHRPYPAISLPLGGNTRTMQPLSADGWLTIPLKLPRKGAYPITATRREKVYETSF